MRDDRTADRLAALLPFPADHPVAVLGWPELSGAALAIRPDLEALAVRTNRGDDRWRARLARSDASARPVDLVEAARARTVAPAGRGGRRRPDPGAGARRHRRRAGRAVASRDGRVAGRRGRAACCRPACSRPCSAASAIPSDHDLELLDVQVADRIAGPTGLVRPEQLLRRVDCPVAPELLRFS